MPNYLGTGTMIGNVGNGYAKITQISFLFKFIYGIYETIQ